LRLDQPLNLGVRRRTCGDGAERSDPGACPQPFHERDVIVAEPQRHQAPERLASVRLGDAEVSFALDESRDEMAFRL
jgi:hypothetical protein